MAQVHTNGRSDLVGPTLQLGDFLPERREVRLNGQTHQAWVTTNSRYPRRIMAELDSAARTYNVAIEPIRDIIGLPDAMEQIAADPLKMTALENQPVAWDRYITSAVAALIPTVLESELELVDLPVLEQWLRDLGYLPSLRTESPGESST